METGTEKQVTVPDVYELNKYDLARYLVNRKDTVLRVGLKSQGNTLNRFNEKNSSYEQKLTDITCNSRSKVDVVLGNRIDMITISVLKREYCVSMIYTDPDNNSKLAFLFVCPEITFAKEISLSDYLSLKGFKELHAFINEQIDFVIDGDITQIFSGKLASKEWKLSVDDVKDIDLVIKHELDFGERK